MQTIGEIRPEQMKAALAANAAHLTDRELDGFLDDSLGEAAHVRVESHLAACSRCATELWLLREFRSVTPRAEEADAVRLIARQLQKRVSRALARRRCTEKEDAKLLVMTAGG